MPFNAPLLATGFFTGGIGLWTALATLGVFLWALQSGRSHAEAQCLMFVTLVMIELFNCRSKRLSLFQVGVFKNRWLLAAVASSFLLTLPLFYVPFLREPFHTYPLGLSDWATVVVAGIGKLVARKAKTSPRALRTAEN